MERMTKVDENMTQAKKMLETIVERDYELQKEVGEWRSKCYILEEENKKLKEENNRLKNNAMEDMRVQTKLEEKIRFLEECLDRKEKLNEEYRKEIEKLKSTYVYDAKQVRDIC